MTQAVCKQCSKPIATTCACRPLGTKKRRQKKVVEPGKQLRFAGATRYRGTLYKWWRS